VLVVFVQTVVGELASPVTSQMADK